MKLTEYAGYDALGLAELVASKQISPKELADCVTAAIEAVNPAINAVVETYPDRIDSLDEKTLGNGPFRGVPFLIKDVYGHEAGRKVEFGSRLCAGMRVLTDTHVFDLLRASGVNVLGRSAAPEYSLVGTTEGALYGNTSNPWRERYSAGGSSGGAMAAVLAGIVPIAQGTDIAGSIRIPASYCGGVGLKPSRGRVSYGPGMDENGFGLGQNFVQTKTVRDAATMLDCLAVPWPGDPFLIPASPKPYAALAAEKPPRLKIGWSTDGLMGLQTDTEVAQAVAEIATLLAEMGHEVTEESPDTIGVEAMASMADVWFFGFDVRLQAFAKRSGRSIGLDTLEPVTLTIFEHARQMTSGDLLKAMAVLNSVRRKLGRYFVRYDAWLSPTTTRVAEPWGNYGLGKSGMTMMEIAERVMRPTCQFTLPHNIMGTPAISLPLAVNSAGLPIGIQLGLRPAREDLALQLAAELERARPWAGRTPPLHASRRAQS